MSDRSALSIRIYQADPAKAEELKAYIVDEWSPSEGTDLLKDLFVVPEVSLGSADGVHDDLIRIDNTAVFAVWQDPKYEFMGDLVMHHPALGTFSAESDATGSPRPSYEKVVALGVDTAFGRAWFDAIASIGSAVALLIFTFITAAHFRVRTETRANAAILAVAVTSSAVVLVTFIFTTLIHEPASIVTLLAILVLSVALDLGWKRTRAGRTPSEPPTGRLVRET